MAGNPQFAPMDPAKKAAMLAGIAAGRKPREIAEEVGISVATVRNYATREKKRDREPELFEPPPTRAAREPKAPDREPATRSAPRSPAAPRPRAAGADAPLSTADGRRIVEGAFRIVSLFLGSGWTLDSHEAGELGASLAEASDVIPPMLRGMLRRYTSPAIFAGSLGAIVSNRVTLAQQQAAGVAPGPYAVPDRPARTVPPPPAATAPNPGATAYVSPPMNGRLREVHASGGDGSPGFGAR